LSGPLLRVDMHLHTHRSFDSLNRYPAILRAARERGIDRLVITDHNSIEGAIALRDIDPARIIVGEEVKTREGFDIIGIFLESLIPEGTPALQTCRRILDQGGIVYLPHPFDGTRAARPQVLRSILAFVDVVEVHNARCWPVSLNHRAETWAREHGKLMGSGSDAHTIREIGRGYVEVPFFEPNRESFLQALAHGKVAGRQSTSPAFRLASNWTKVRKKLPW
jgi:predicted metal-dependent phosphoesterase TrpH